MPDDKAAAYGPPRPFQIPGTPDRLQPAAPLYLGPDDFLQIETANSLAGATIRVVARIWRSDGSLGYFDETFTPASNRTSQITTKQIGEGYLESLCVIDNLNTLKRGHCYVQVFIAHGSPGTNLATGILVQDYVTSTFSPAWPGGQLRPSTDGPGLIRAILGTQPGAGADIAETVPTGARWRLQSIFAQLVTAVAVANRIPSWLIDDGANTTWFASNTANQVASTTTSYSAAPGSPGQTSGTTLVALCPLPAPLFLLAGWRIRTVTTAIQGADQWSQPKYAVEEWIEL